MVGLVRQPRAIVLQQSRVNPKVAYQCRVKMLKSASDVAARRLGQVEAYLTVREVVGLVRQPRAIERAQRFLPV